MGHSRREIMRASTSKLYSLLVEYDEKRKNFRSVGQVEKYREAEREYQMIVDELNARLFGHRNAAGATEFI